MSNQNDQLRIQVPNSNNYTLADANVDDDGKPKRTGNMWTVSAHILTAVVGSGVLSLAWSLAQLGWIAGVGTLLIFSAITYLTSTFMADCYRFPNSPSGKRNYTYMDAVNSYLGDTKCKACGIAQYINLAGLAVVWRTSLVVVVTVLAMAFPFFNAILGLLGAISYWPTTVYFPVEMRIAQKKMKQGTTKWLGLQVMNLLCLCIAIAAAVGSIAGLSKSVKDFKPFQF
ncbi:hypothetical protein ACFE04_016391 [Oxalis oulophora]